MAEIKYSTNKDDLVALKIDGFFEGWNIKPSKDVLLRSVENSDFVVLAIDEESQILIGYITALSDNVLSAYIPFLEVRKDYRDLGVGSTLVQKMLAQLKHLYMIDLVCDKNLVDFYKKNGKFNEWHSMIIRNYENQGGVIQNQNIDN